MRERRKIQRILVALDVSPGSLVAAEAAAELAVLLQAELRGLFVVDADVLMMSASPLAREVDFVTASPRSAESGDVELQLKVRADRARKALERIAAAAGIPSSFQVARGAVASEIAAAAETADLVSLGRLGWSLRRERLLGETARKLLLERRGITLLSERRVRIKPPIVVLYDGSEAGCEALALAELLAVRTHGPLQILLLGEDPESLRREVANVIDEAAADVWSEHLGQHDPERLTSAVCRRAGGVVVAPLGHLLGGDHLQRLLKEVACPVLAIH